MIGFGPKRNAEGLRQREPAPTPDELDDIFAPEPVQSSPQGQAPHPRAEPETGAPTNPSNVRTRLILRRALIRQARAERVSRKLTPAPAAPARSSAKPAVPKKRAAPAPAKAAKPDRKPLRKSRGLQLGLAAAVAGVICGTVVAYFANDYFNDGLSAQNIDEAASQAASREIEPAATAVPPDVAEARASTQPAAFSGEDDAPPAEKTAGKSYEEPLPVPSALPQEETEAETNEAGVADDPPPAATETTEAETTEIEESSVVAEEPAQVAAVDPATPTEPARDKLVPGSLETFRDCDRCPVMVKLPPAEFTMGSAESEEGHQPNEGPQRLVKLTKPFAIGQFEITVSDWDACVKDGGCKLQINDEGWGRDKHPAINVSWEDINTQFLPWLSKKTGKKYRLPTEAEWEYAARATMSPDSIARRFSFGDDGNALCAFGNGADATAKEQNGGGTGADCRDGYATTAPAGSFKPNQFGLFDMHGNVWEWVEDCWNESYDNAPADGKAWTDGDCTSRVVRGGSWNSDIPKLRSATRGWNQPSGRNRSIGFRVVREL